jgi:hypothetical protein
MFEIKIASVDASAGSVPVSWCLDLETIKFLADYNVKDPQIIIVVAPDGPGYHVKKESRTVANLKDLMAYVEFRTPGPTKIWAFISLLDRGEAKKKYLRREYGAYYTDVLSWDGSCIENIPWINQTSAKPVSVDVPKGIFAAEPPAWEKTWVNHFFSDKSVDQCAFRRRRLFAYLVQPLLIFGSILIRAFFLLIALLVGAKDTSLMPLIHPLKYDLGDAKDIVSGGTIFVRHVPEDDLDSDFCFGRDFKSSVSYVLRKFCLLPFMPLILGLCTLIFLTSKALFIMGVTLICIAILAAALLIAFYGPVLIERIKDIIEGKSSKEEPWFNDKEEIDSLTCNADKKALTFGTLPEKKKSIKLRFLDLKSKVCRPFSA